MTKPLDLVEIWLLQNYHTTRNSLLCCHLGVALLRFPRSYAASSVGIE